MTIKNKILQIICMMSFILPSVSIAQLLNYQRDKNTNTTTYQTSIKTYGIGKTNYYTWNGTGDKTDVVNYDYVSQIPLELKLYNPDTLDKPGKRAVLIIIPGSGRQGCIHDGCSTKTKVEKTVPGPKGTANLVSAEGKTHYDVGASTAKKFAERRFVVLSLNTRFQYHNQQEQSKQDWPNLLNTGSIHMENLIVDIRRAVRWIVKHSGTGTGNYNIDPDNIFIMGSSGGSKMSSLAQILPSDKLTVDDPSILNNTGSSDYAFEVNNNNYTPQMTFDRRLRGGIMVNGNLNGTSHLKFLDKNDGAFLFWHGTKDPAILHGLAEAIEEKCDIIGCATQFYSKNNLGHGILNTNIYPEGSKFLHTDYPTSGVQQYFRHMYDFMVGQLKGGASATLPEIFIDSSPTAVIFNENEGTAKIKIKLSQAVGHVVKFTVAASQAWEATRYQSNSGEYIFKEATKSDIEMYLANDRNSTGILSIGQGNQRKVYEDQASWLKDKSHDHVDPAKRPRLLNPGSTFFNGGTFDSTNDRYSDFESKTEIMEFGIGETSKTFEVTIIPDSPLNSYSENNECFKVRLLNANGARIKNAVENITIMDVDGGNSTPEVCVNQSDQGNGTSRVSLQSVSVNESIGNANVALLGENLTEAVTISYSTLQGTATMDLDYLHAAGQKTINPSQSSVNIAVPIIDDTQDENNESFQVIINNIVSGAAEKGNNATVTIIDNDTNTADNKPDIVFTQTSTTSTSPIEVTITATDDFGINSDGVQIHSNSDAEHGQLLCTPNTNRTEIICTITVTSTGRLVVFASDTNPNNDPKYKGVDYTITLPPVDNKPDIVFAQTSTTSSSPIEVTITATDDFGINSDGVQINGSTDAEHGQLLCTPNTNRTEIICTITVTSTGRLVVFASDTNPSNDPKYKGEDYIINLSQDTTKPEIFYENVDIGTGVMTLTLVVTDETAIGCTAPNGSDSLIVHEGPAVLSNCIDHGNTVKYSGTITRGNLTVENKTKVIFKATDESNNDRHRGLEFNIPQ